MKYLYNIWTDTLNADLHWFPKGFLLLLMISLASTPLMIVVRVVEIISSDLYAIVFATIALISGVLAYVLFKKRKEVDDKMKEAKAMFQQIDTARSNEESIRNDLKNTIQQKKMEIDVLKTQIKELKKDKNNIKDSLQQVEGTQSERLDLTRKEYELKAEHLKNQYEVALKNYKQKIIDENHELIQEQASKYGQEKSRNRIAEIQEFYEQKMERFQEEFKQNYRDEIEKLAKEKAKSYLRNELPFD